MDINSLMVGDWVCLVTQQGYYKNIQWSSIDYQLYGYHDKRPIPLSEDILVTNGFKKQPYVGCKDTYEDAFTEAIEKSLELCTK